MKDVYESDYYNHHQMSAALSLSPSAIQINQSSKRSGNNGSSNNGTVLGRFLKLGKSKSDANSQGNSKRRGAGDVDAEDEFRLNISSSAQNLRGAEKMVHKANLRKDNVSKSHSWIFGPTKQPTEHAPFVGFNSYGPPSPSGAQFAADNYLHHSPSLHQQHHHPGGHQMGPTHAASYGNLDYSHLQHLHQNSHHMQMPIPMCQPMPREYYCACEFGNPGLLAPAPCHACNVHALSAVNNAKFAKNRKQQGKEPSESESKTFASSVRKLTWKSLKQAVKKRPSIDSLKSPPPPGTADTNWNAIPINNNGNFVDAVGPFMSQDDVLNATTTNYFFPSKKAGGGGCATYYGSCADLFTGVGRNGSALSHPEPPQHVTASVRVRPKRSRETWHFPNELGPTPNYQQQEHGAYHSEWDLRNYVPYEEWLTVANGNGAPEPGAADAMVKTESGNVLNSIGEPFEVTLVHNSSNGSESGTLQNQNTKASAKINRPSTNNGNCNGTTITCNNVNNNSNNGKGVISVGSSSTSTSSSSSTSLSPADIYSNGGVKRFSILNNELNAYQLNKRNHSKSQQQQDEGEEQDDLTDEDDNYEKRGTQEESRGHVRVAGQGITIARSNSSSSASKKATTTKGNHPHHLIISSASSESDLSRPSAKSSFSTFTGHYAKSNVNINGNGHVTTTRITTDGNGSDGEYENHYSSYNNRDSSSSTTILSSSSTEANANKVSTTSSSTSSSSSSSSGNNSSNVKIRSIVKSQKREQRENGATTVVEVLDNSSAAEAKNFAPSQNQSQRSNASVTNSNSNKNSSNPKYGALRRRKQRSGKHSSKNLLRETIYEEEGSGEEANNVNGTDPDANGIYTVKIVVNSNSNSHSHNGNVNGGSDYAYVKPILKTQSHYASVTNNITNSHSNANFNNSNTDSDYCTNSVNSSATKGVKFTAVRVPKKKVQFNKEKVVIMCGVDEDHTSDDCDENEKSEVREYEPDPIYDENECQPEAESDSNQQDYSDWDSSIQDSQCETLNTSNSVSEDSSVKSAYEEAENGMHEEPDSTTSDVIQSNHVELDDCYNQNNAAPAADANANNGNSQFNSSNEVNNLVGYAYVTSSLLSSAAAAAKHDNNGNETISVAAACQDNGHAQVQHEAREQYQHKFNKKNGNSSTSSNGVGKSQLVHQNQILNKRSNRMKHLNNNNANTNASSTNASSTNAQVFAQDRNRGTAAAATGKEDDKRKLVYHEDHEKDAERNRRVVRALPSPHSNHNAHQQQHKAEAPDSRNAKMTADENETITSTNSNANNLNNLPLKAEQIFNNKQLLNKGRGSQAAKILNPNSLLFNDTTRIRLNQARPSLDQTFQILNLRPGDANQSKQTGGILRKSNGVRPSHSFRTSAPPLAPLRPRDPPPPPPPAAPNAVAAGPGARPQLPARPKSFPAALTNPVNPKAIGATNSHYRSPTTKAQISLPMPMLGFSTTNSSMNAMKTRPTSNPAMNEQSRHENSPRNRASQNRPVVKKSANSNSSLADKCEAVEKVLSQKLGRITSNKISSPSPVQLKASTTNNNSHHLESSFTPESPVYANIPFPATAAPIPSPAIGKPLPPPPVPPHQSMPMPIEQPSFNLTANELQRAKSNLMSNGSHKPNSHNDKAVADNNLNVDYPRNGEVHAELNIYSDTSSNSSSAKNETFPRKEIHYASTDLLDKNRISMEDEINYHHSHYNGNNSARVPSTSVVLISDNDNEKSTMNVNKKTPSSVSPSPSPSTQSQQSIDLISGPRTQNSPLPPPIPMMNGNQMNGSGGGSLMHGRIEDKVVGQPDKSNKSQHHVQHRHSSKTDEPTKNVLNTEQDHKGNEEEPLYDDVLNHHAMNRNNNNASKVQPCAQPNLGKTYAISPPKDAPPPIPPHSAVFIASLSKSTGSNYAQQLRKANNDSALIYDDNAVINHPAPAVSSQNSKNDHYGSSKGVVNEVISEERKETPKPVASLSDANTNLVHFIEEDLIYDDTSAFNLSTKEEHHEEEPLPAEPLYDDVLNFAKSCGKNDKETLDENDSGTESNSPPPPLPTSGPPIHLLPKISLDLPVILSTAVSGLTNSCTNTLKSIKDKSKKRLSIADEQSAKKPSQPKLSQSKSHSDLTNLINETLRLSKANSTELPQLCSRSSTSLENDNKTGDEELLDKTRSLLNELNEKLAKFSTTTNKGPDYSSFMAKLGQTGNENGGSNGNGTPPGSSSSDSSSGVEEDYNSEKNYSLSLNEDDCATLTPNSSSSSPAAGSLHDDNAYKLSQVSKLVNETMALARGKFLDSMKPHQERNTSSSHCCIEEPIYEEISESKSNSQEFHNQRNRSGSPIYADTFDAKSIFDGASRGEILSFLESIRDRLAAVDSSSNSLNKPAPASTGISNKKTKKAKDIERNDSGIGSEAGSIVAILGAAQNAANGSGFLTLCKDCHSLPIEAAADDASVDANTKTQNQICSACVRKRNERKEIIQEIYETELKYGRDLRIILDEFYNPIQVAGLLTKEQLDLIFLNVVQLIEINVELTSSLKTNIEDSIKARDEDLMNVSIGRIFLEFGEKMMSGFESYCTRQASAGALLTQLEKEKELLRIFLRVSQMENAVLRRMNLPAFLMVPVQRVTRYPLLLSRLLKVTSTDHPQMVDLQMAADKIEQHLEHMNNTTREVASHKMWRRISIINGGSSSPIHRRSSTSSTNSDPDANNNGANARIRKMAFDVMNWTDQPDAFCIAISQLSTVHMNGKSFRHVFACLLARGKNLERLIHKMHQDQEVFFPPKVNELLIPQQQQQEIDVKDVKLILVRVKNTRLSLFREPLCLSNCIISQGENEFQDFVEMNEITTKNMYHFQGMDKNGTSEWLRLLQCHAVCVGQWRRRRGALANIMMNGMIRHL